MKKCKKGISLVSVLIVVVILAIVSGVITISTNNILEDTYKKEFVSEYKLVKTATKDYIMRNSDIIDFTETEFDVSGLDSELLEQFNGETIVNEKFDVYIIDLEKIGVSNATYGTGTDEDSDIYVLSKNTKEVYYKKGFTDDNNTYYKGIND